MNHTDKLEQLQKAVADLVAEREWQQFHTPRNTCAKITIEAAELLELFEWTAPGQDEHKLVEQKLQAIRHEVADVLLSLLMFCRSTGIDPYEATLEKLEEIKAKYPVDQVKGKPHKYTHYQKK